MLSTVPSTAPGMVSRKESLWLSPNIQLQRANSGLSQHLGLLQIGDMNMPLGNSHLYTPDDCKFKKKKTPLQHVSSFSSSEWTLEIPRMFLKNRNIFTSGCACALCSVMAAALGPRGL